MSYPTVSNLEQQAELLKLYARLKHEHGASGIQRILDRTHREMRKAVRALQSLPSPPSVARRHPNDLPSIQQLRSEGPRRLWPAFRVNDYSDRLQGALLGRMAGCTLGAPVELWSIERMKKLAKENGIKYPPRHYWPRVPDPYDTRYNHSIRASYTLSGMKGVPVDDDIAYTLLGLLILEEHGPDFSVADVGTAWRKYLPLAHTAEKVALDNLLAGVPPMKAGEKDNPYREWIGAFIRSDPWGYMAPGWPEKAAAMAWRDAYISHRGNGIYGEMYFAAAFSAAFALSDPTEALSVALSEIPKDSDMARAARWALKTAPRVRDYRQAREAVEKQFRGMHQVHTINNACLAIFGVAIGGTDFTRAIGETVAMGLDNDCTAATVGSIVGATVGKAGIPEHWYAPFQNTVHSYLKGKPSFRIDNLVRRFTRQARRVWKQ